MRTPGLWLWVVIDVAAVAVLGLALLYGTRMWRNRSVDPAVLKESDAETLKLYHHPVENRARRRTRH